MASAGKPLKSTVNMTPVPFAGTVAVIVPVIVEPVSGSKLVVGRTAWKVSPAVFACTVAFPSTPVRVPCELALYYILIPEKLESSEYS